jgi:hypothetical protein
MIWQSEPEKLVIINPEDRIGENSAIDFKAGRRLDACHHRQRTTSNGSIDAKIN